MMMMVMMVIIIITTPCPEKCATIFLPLTLPNVDQFLGDRL